MSYENKGILEILGLTNLPKERQAEIIGKMTELVQKRAMLRAIEGLKGKDLEDAKKIFSEADPQEILDFIAERIPNFNEILKEEVEKLKIEMATENSKIASEI